jgi:hypothetical protein
MLKVGYGELFGARDNHTICRKERRANTQQMCHWCGSCVDQALLRQSANATDAVVIVSCVDGPLSVTSCVGAAIVRECSGVRML